MRLEDCWSVDPKASDRLESALGRKGAVVVIESAGVRVLVDAGVARGRAVRILRRADGQAGIGALTTRDARNVYDDLLSPASGRGLTGHVADHIRVLTPLPTVEIRRDHLDRVLTARGAWADLDDDIRDTIETTFREYDVASETERATVHAAFELHEARFHSEPLDALAEADPGALRNVLGAFGYVDNDGSVTADAGDRLNDLRSRLDIAKEPQSGSFDVFETVRSRGVRSLSDFRVAFTQHATQETNLPRGEIEAIAAGDVRDTTDSVSASLRALVEDLEADVVARRETVAKELRDRIWAVRDNMGLAVETVDEVALPLLLTRFTDEYDLTPPDIAETGLAICDAHNPFIDDPQSVSYAIGDHELACVSGPTSPVGDRVLILAGANGDGKTTLLKTLSQVTIPASMGLPVPMGSAIVGRLDLTMFHRRYTNFNMGALESAIKSIVPPLSDDGWTLMLVDEFEAIIESRRTADLLNGPVNLAIGRDAFGVYITHLADELNLLSPKARINGIFAEGPTDELGLRVDHQPWFGAVGKSTPEFIVPRLVANVRDRAERAGSEAPVAVVGEETAQKTLSDAEFVD